MKVYKGKFLTKLFWSFCSLCAGWFIFNVVLKFVPNLMVALVLGILVALFLLYKIYFLDNIAIVLTDDGQLLVKRLGKVIKSFILESYIWSEYSKYSNVKNAEDQDIYYIDKVTGQEDSIDCTNFSSSDYEELLHLLGAKKESEPVKVNTIKK